MFLQGPVHASLLAIMTSSHSVVTSSDLDAFNLCPRRKASNLQYKIVSLTKLSNSLSRALEVKKKKKKILFEAFTYTETFYLLHLQPIQKNIGKKENCMK